MPVLCRIRVADRINMADNVDFEEERAGNAESRTAFDTQPAIFYIVNVELSSRLHCKS